MLIEGKGILKVSIPFIGLFICKSDEGNKLCVLLSPRTQYLGGGRGTGNQGWNALSEIRAWIGKNSRNMKRAKSKNPSILQNWPNFCGRTCGESNDDSDEIEDLITTPQTGEAVFVRTH